MELRESKGCWVFSLYHFHLVFVEPIPWRRLVSYNLISNFGGSCNVHGDETPLYQGKQWIVNWEALARDYYAKKFCCSWSYWWLLLQFCSQYCLDLAIIWFNLIITWLFIRRITVNRSLTTETSLENLYTTQSWSRSRWFKSNFRSL